MRKYIFSIVVIVLLILPTHFVFGQAASYLQCDACGLCKDTQRSALSETPNEYRDKLGGSGSVYVMPGSWKSCFTCLYEGVKLSQVCQGSGTSDIFFVRPSNEGDVLAKIDEDGNLDESGEFYCDTLISDPSKAGSPLLTPVPGRMYTGLGCIGVSGGQTFSDPNASVDVVSQLLRILTGVAGAIGLFAITTSAFKLLTSQGDTEKIHDGKRMLINSILGLIFTLFALFIFRFVAGQVLKIPGVG